MTRGATPPRPEEEVSKLKVRVLNLERILRGLRKAKPGIFDVPSISLEAGGPWPVPTGTDRYVIPFASQARTDSFRTKGRLVGTSQLLILEGALYAVTWSTSFAASADGARGAEVVEVQADGSEVLLTSTGPSDAEASGSENFRASGAAIVPIAAGSSLELRVWQTSGGDLDTAFTPRPRLGVAWLGRQRLGGLPGES